MILGPVSGPAAEVASAHWLQTCDFLLHALMRQLKTFCFSPQARGGYELQELDGLEDYGDQIQIWFLGLNHFVNVFQCGSEIQYLRRTLFGTLHTI